MTGPLILWLSDPLDEAWHWHLSPTQHGAAHDAAAKAALSEKTQDGLWVILPGQWARLHPIDLPSMRARERMAAAGFSIEDKLGKSLKEQHVSLTVGDGVQRAGVIDNAKMEQVLVALSAVGLKPDQMFADFDVCRPLGQAYSFEGRAILCGPEGYAMDLGMYDALEPGPIPTPARIEQLSADLETAAAVNFLQGAYAAKTGGFGNTQQLWRVAAAAGVCGLLALGWQASLTRAASQQANMLREQTATLYQKATGKRPKGSPALAVTRALKSGQAGDVDFLGLSNILFSAIAQTENVILDSLQFDAKQARLSVRVMYPNFAAATALEAAITANGGRFQAGSVRELDGQMVGEGVVTLGRAP